MIIYADRLTDSVRAAVETTNRRRKLQIEYNRKHGIKPRSTRRTLKEKKDPEKIGCRGRYSPDELRGPYKGP